MNCDRAHFYSVRVNRAAIWGKAEKTLRAKHTEARGKSRLPGSCKHFCRSQQNFFCESGMQDVTPRFFPLDIYKEIITLCVCHTARPWNKRHWPL